MTEIERICRRWWGAQRMDGVAAADWRNSVFTRHRTDLPFPPCPAPKTILRVVR